MNTETDAERALRHQRHQTASDLYEAIRLVTDAVRAELDTLEPGSAGWDYLRGKIDGLMDARGVCLDCAISAVGRETL